MIFFMGSCNFPTSSKVGVYVNNEGQVRVLRVKGEKSEGESAGATDKNKSVAPSYFCQAEGRTLDLLIG